MFRFSLRTVVRTGSFRLSNALFAIVAALVSAWPTPGVAAPTVANQVNAKSCFVPAMVQRVEFEPFAAQVVRGQPVPLAGFYAISSLCSPDTPGSVQFTLVCNQQQVGAPVSSEGKGQYSLNLPGSNNLETCTIEPSSGASFAHEVVFVAPGQQTTVSIAPGVPPTLPANTPLTLSAQVTTPPGVTVSKVEFYSLQMGRYDLVGSDTTAPYSATFTPVATAQRLFAMAYDSRGYRASSTGWPTMVSSNQAPLVRLISPTVNQTFGQPATVHLELVASDVDGYVKQVRFYTSAYATTPVHTINRTAISTTPYAFDWTNVAAGSYQIFAEVDDNLQLPGATVRIGPIPITVTNNAPQVSISMPLNDGEYLDGGVATTVTATIRDDGPSVNAPTFRFRVANYSDVALTGSVPTQVSPGVWTSSVTYTPPQSTNSLENYGGKSTVTATATDAAGLSGTSAERRYIVTGGSYYDPPAFVQILEPIATQKARPGYNVTFAACARDRNISNQTVTPNSVKFALDTVSNFITTSGSGSASTRCPVGLLYTATVVLPAATSLGTHQIHASAFSGTTNLGYTIASTPINVVNSLPPSTKPALSNAATTLTLPISGVSVMANAVDLDSTITLIEYFLNGVKQTAPTATSSSLAWTPTETGKYEWKVKVTDSQGNVTESAPLVITVNNVAGNLPPTVEITSPEIGAIREVGANSLKVQVSSWDNQSVDHVDLFDGATLLGQMSILSQGSYIYTWNNIATGSHLLTARAVDNQGGVSISLPVQFFVTSKAPTINLTAPVNNSSVIAPETISLSADAYDDVGLTRVEFYDGANKIAQLTSAPWTLNYQVTGAGTRDFKAIAYDGASFTASNTARVTFLANNPPTGTLNAPTGDRTYLTTQAVSFSMSAYSDPDSGSGDSVTKIEYLVGGKVVVTGTPATAFAASKSNLAVGDNLSVQAKIYDQNAGITLVPTPARTITVRAPLPPVVALTAMKSVDQDGNFFPGEPVIFEATATDPDQAEFSGQITKVEFFEQPPAVNGVPATPVSLGADTQAPYSVTWTIPPGASLGDRQIFARATDSLAGQTSQTDTPTQTLTIRVNHAPAAIAIVNPVIPSYYETATVKRIEPTVIRADTMLTLSAKVEDLESNASMVEFGLGQNEFLALDQAGAPKLTVTAPIGSNQSTFTGQLLVRPSSIGSTFIFARVTDRRGLSLTTRLPAQPGAQGYRNFCGNRVGFPVINDHCWNLAVPVAVNGYPEPGPACGGAGNQCPPDSPSAGDIGTPHVVNITAQTPKARIQAERYNANRQAVGYFEKDSYRPDSSGQVIGQRRDDVELTDCKTASGEPAPIGEIYDSCVVSGIDNGEYLKYSLQVGQSANYGIKARMWIPGASAVVHRPKFLQQIPYRTSDQNTWGIVNDVIQAWDVRGTQFRVAMHHDGDLTNQVTLSPWQTVEANGPAYKLVFMSWKAWQRYAPSADGGLHRYKVWIQTRQNENDIQFVNWPAQEHVVNLVNPATLTPAQLSQPPSSAETAIAEAEVELSDEIEELEVSDSKKSWEAFPYTSGRAVSDQPISLAESCTGSTEKEKPSDPLDRWYTVTFCESQPLAGGNYVMRYRSPRHGVKLDWFEFSDPVPAAVRSVAITSPTNSQRLIGNRAVVVRVAIQGNTTQGLLGTFKAVGPSDVIGQTWNFNTPQLGSTLTFEWATPNVTSDETWTLVGENVRIGSENMTVAPVQVAVTPFVGNLPPQIQVTKPASAVPVNTAVAMEAIVTDPDNSGIASVFFIIDNGTPVAATSIGQNKYAYTWPASSAIAGAHTLKVQATDSGSPPQVTVSQPVTFVVGAAEIVPQPFESLDSELPEHNPSVGTLPGTAGTEGGAATYNIPISVPPGRMGMQPNFALNYSSRGGAGIAGIGWSLSGLSSIHRCPQTVEQDGIAKAVTYSASDRLCLDGSRLVLMSAEHQYGDEGATYRTEIDTFARITQYKGGLTSASTCFKVEAKSGQISWYGGYGTDCDRSMSNSFSVAGGLTLPMNWMLDRTEDRNGNNVKYVYQTYNPGETLLTEARYTGFNGTDGNRRVVFAYSPSPMGPGTSNYTGTYLQGGLSVHSQRLVSVTTHAPTSTTPNPTPNPNEQYTIEPVRVYELSYGEASQYSGRSLLRSIRECPFVDGVKVEEACHGATTFAMSETRAPHVLKPMEISGIPEALRLNLPANSSGEAPEGFYDAAARFGFLPAVRAYQEQSAQRTTLSLSQLTQSFAEGTTVNDQWLSAFELVGDLNGDGVQEAAVSVRTWANPGQTQLLTRRFLVQQNTNRTMSAALDFANLPSGFAPLLSPDNGGGPGPNLNDGRQRRGDIDNDGRTDLLGTVNGNVAFAMWNSTLPPPGQLAPPISLSDFVIRTTSIPNGLDTQALDLNLDGRLDILTQMPESTMCASSHRALVYYLNQSTSPESLSFGSANLIACLEFSSLVSHHERFARAADFNGDGTADIWIRRFFPDNNSADSIPAHFETQGVLLSSLNANGALSFTWRSLSDLGLQLFEIGEDVAETSGRNYGFWMDVNGDGLEDVVSGGYKWFTIDGQYNWRIRLNKGGVLGPAINTGSRAGMVDGHIANGSTYFLGIAGPTMQRDANQDGKLDLLIPTGFAMRMCQLVRRVPGGSCGNNDNVVCPYQDHYFCPEDPATGDRPPQTPVPVAGGGTVEYPTFGMYRWGRSGWNGSLYTMSALHFVQTGPESFTVEVRQAQGMVAGSSQTYTYSSADIYGDGLSDQIQPVGCPFGYSGTVPLPPDCLVPQDGIGPAQLPSVPPVSNSIFENPANRRIYWVENQGAGERGANLPPIVPELLREVRDAYHQGNVPANAQWDYFPLSSDAGRSNSLTQIGELPLYRVPARESGRGYVDARHFYFESSMSVVASFRDDNGLAGYNETRFGYEEAMFNNRGRGIQGFRAVTVDTLKPKSRTRTRTLFHQKFPLTSQVESIEVRAVGENGQVQGLLSKQEMNWRCHHSGMGAAPQRSSLCPSQFASPQSPTMGVLWFPFVDSSRSYQYDGSAALNGTGRDALPESETLSVNAASESGGASGYDAYGNLWNTLKITRDLAAPIRLQEQRQISASIYATPQDGPVQSWWLDKLISSSASASVIWANDHAPPLDVNTPSQSTQSFFTYSDDGKRRLVNTRVEASGQWTEASIEEFSAEGLPTRARTNASGLTVPRTGDSILSQDHYFVQTVINALGHRAEAVTRPRDGQVEKATDAAGRTTVRVFDAWGTVQGEDTVYGDPVPQIVLAPEVLYSISPCGGSCVVSADVPTPILRTTRVQAGAPTSIQYVDRQGRTVATRTRLPDGTWSVSESKFDAGGRAYENSNMHRTNEVALWNSVEFDELGRPSRKVEVPGGANGLPVLASRETRYAYSGKRVEIAVKPVGSACVVDDTTCFTVAREVDSLGRVIRSQDQSGELAYYWFDGGGNAVAIQGVDGQKTTASYNGLGQRASLSDPDMGNWSFTYSGLGEVLTQTDARNVLTTNQYDILGRLRLSNSTALDLGEGFGTQAVNDTFSYDLSIDNQSVPGALTEQSRSLSGSGLIWQQQYRFDTAARPIETLTRLLGTNNQLLLFTEQDAYHPQYGWVYKHTYPSGLNVGTRYTKYGHAYAISDGGGLDWHVITQWNGQGNAISELFGNGLEQRSWYAAGSGQIQKRDLTSGSGTLDTWTYGYDGLGNVALQSRQFGQNGNTVNALEQFVYDLHQRLKKTTRTLGGVSAGAEINYDYAPNGNLRLKSDYGNNYLYGSGNAAGSVADAGPHAVTQVTRLGGVGGVDTFTYDDNGNLNGGNTLSAKYDQDNMPWYVQRIGAGKDLFAYDAMGTRFRHQEFAAGTNLNTQTTYYGGTAYERVIRNPGQANETVEHRHHLDGVVVTLLGADGLTAPRTLSYLHTDGLGSTSAMTDALGQVLERRSYDAFGAARNGDFSDRSNGTLDLDQHPTHQNRGFTGHEHLDETRLIHMNGRTYDYRLGRFLAVDPFIQFPSNSQSLNPYSYILNNPLSGKDPSGYAASCDMNKLGACLSEMKTGDTITVREQKEGSRINANIATITKVENTFKVTSGGGSSETWHRVSTSDGQTKYISEENLNKLQAVDQGAVVLRDNGSDSSQRASNPRTSNESGNYDNSEMGSSPGQDALKGAKDAAQMGAEIAYQVADPCNGSDVDGCPKELAKNYAFGIAVGKGVEKTGESMFAFGRWLGKAEREAGMAPDPALEGWSKKAVDWSRKVFCFAQGTQVQTPSGRKDIEKIEAGDIVVTLDTETGEISNRVVLELVRGFTDHWYELELEGELTRVTGAHPFWIAESKTWEYARNLSPGMRLLGHDGSLHTVERVTLLELERPEPTYNFEVEGTHNYFAGGARITVLNHNIDPREMYFSRPPSEISGTDSFTAGHLRGRTLNDMVSEARQLGRLPDSMQLNAARMISPSGEELIVAANNRTLWVAIQAGLNDVSVKGLESDKVWKTVSEHLIRNGGPFCAR